MNSKTFTEELEKIYREANEKVVALVNKAQEEEGLSWDTTENVSFADDPNWNYKADAFAEMGGWIYDRLNGMTRLDKKSITKKIRKALGYSYP